MTVAALWVASMEQTEQELLDTIEALRRALEAARRRRADDEGEERKVPREFPSEFHGTPPWAPDQPFFDFGDKGGSQQQWGVPGEPWKGGD